MALPRGLRVVQNPPNPWHSTSIEYLDAEPNPDELDPHEGAPIARLEVIEDATRNILAENSSPDVGFRWSVNPYRGCFHACSYCLSGDTRILMGDGSHRELRELRTGDEIYGTVRCGAYRRYVKTNVRDVWQTIKPAWRLVADDGTTIVASGDHRFLTQHGWRYVAGNKFAATRRERIRIGDALVGAGTRKGERKLRPDVLVNDGPRVVEVEPLGVRMTMFDITTGTGDFIAEGVVSHNCYARPQHEYLGFGAGTDFDRKIVVKPRAPELLREAFEAPKWQGEFIMFSGDTDCYQPLEASYELTRKCLMVCAEYRNPCAVITKSPLIERDIDVLVELSKVTRFGVTISIPFWDVAKARAIEPFVATPQRRVHTIEKLANAGIEVGVNVAPMIPGLGDEDMAKILRAAREAGAKRAGFVFLRLPGPVADVFEERLRKALPLRAEKVLARVREGRGGKLYDSRWGVRQRGEGPYADAARALFEAETERLGLVAEHPTSSGKMSTFRRPPKSGTQLGLFAEPEWTEST